jgi:hypothetical protein|tara:strand:+ start:207 stop:464 length:258 start_codon:yes stop_codon:yes gene_type:complete
MNYKAIYALYPNVVTMNETTAWDASGNVVTINQSTVNAWVDPDLYKYKRANEYPSIADQLDDIYHNGIDGWKATIKTTKDKYPKG